MSISRRSFLHVVGAGGLATAVGGLPSTNGFAAPLAPPTASGDPTLVLITLYGGNDALNTVVPVEDATYRAARGVLALDPAATHPLGDGFALHPELGGLKGLWDDQRLGIVHGVGFGDLDRSHFHCMDVWQAGSEDDQSTGWLGRWLDLIGDDALDAVAVGNELPLALRGATRAAAVVPVGPFVLPGGASLRRGVASLNDSGGDRSGLAALVAATSTDLLAVVDTMGPLLGDRSADQVVDDAPAATGRRSSGLAGQLDVVATSIEAGISARVYSASLGGFDTHAGQASIHASLLGELDAALTGFVERMGARPVTVVVHSEFGRRVAVNGSGGTDHGTAGIVLVAGNVRPGFHGEPSPLDALVDGDLITTVDFRRVYGGLLEGVLGIDGADVLPDAPSPLSLL